MRPVKRQETAPVLGFNGDSSNNLSSAAARAAELVNGSHTISSGQTPRPNLGLPATPGLQASRPAPPRPILAGTRPAPPTPKDHTPSFADLRARQKAHGPPDLPAKTSTPVAPRSDASQGRSQAEGESQRPGQDQGQGQAQDQKLEQKAQGQVAKPSHGQGAASRPPLGPPSKSSPANTFPVTQPASGPAASTVGPPPVKPLQPVKKVPPPAAPAVTVSAPADGDKGGVAAAAAALEKPKEKRISTMNEAQIMEKLRSVVSEDDPKSLYSKIKKVGQG
jgi:hypothetical protein